MFEGSVKFCHLIKRAVKSAATVLIYDTGTINLQSGGSLSARDVQILDNGNLNFTGGALAFSGDFQGDLAVPQAGTVRFNGLDQTIQGDLSNSGVIVFLAAPDVTDGGYSPITVTGNWTDSPTGEVRVIGGTWDQANRQVVVTAPTSAAAGTQTNIDTASTPRVQVTDGDNSVIVAFDAEEGSINFTASTNSVSQIQARDVVTAWDFDTNAGQNSDKVISMFIGEGIDPDSLAVWHSVDAGSTWTLHDAAITYDDGIATFSPGMCATSACSDWEC